MSCCSGSGCGNDESLFGDDGGRVLIHASAILLVKSRDCVFFAKFPCIVSSGKFVNAIVTIDGDRAGCETVSFTDNRLVNKDVARLEVGFGVGHKDGLGGFEGVGATFSVTGPAEVDLLGSRVPSGNRALGHAGTSLGHARLVVIDCWSCGLLSCGGWFQVKSGEVDSLEGIESSLVNWISVVGFCDGLLSDGGDESEESEKSKLFHSEILV